MGVLLFKLTRGVPVRISFLINVTRLKYGLRADASKYQPDVYKSEKSKILKKIHKVALGKLLT